MLLRNSPERQKPSGGKNNTKGFYDQLELSSSFWPELLRPAAGTLSQPAAPGPRVRPRQVWTREGRTAGWSVCLGPRPPTLFCLSRWSVSPRGPPCRPHSVTQHPSGDHYSWLLSANGSPQALGCRLPLLWSPVQPCLPLWWAACSIPGGWQCFYPLLEPCSVPGSYHHGSHSSQGEMEIQGSQGACLSSRLWGDCLGSDPSSSL